MLCDECHKNEATYHSIKKINGSVTERHLCSECQRKTVGEGIAFPSLGGLFSGFNTMFSALPAHKTLRCSKCGTTADSFLQSGFVGCAQCYADMESVINPVISRVQGAERHTGKAPIGREKDPNAEYAVLKARLDKAMDEKNYDEIAVLCDRIRALRGDNYGE
jgi:protein arginine kinase activator